MKALSLTLVALLLPLVSFAGVTYTTFSFGEGYDGLLKYDYVDEKYKDLKHKYTYNCLEKGEDFEREMNSIPSDYSYHELSNAKKAIRSEYAEYDKACERAINDLNDHVAVLTYKGAKTVEDVKKECEEEGLVYDAVRGTCQNDEVLKAEVEEIVSEDTTDTQKALLEQIALLTEIVNQLLAQLATR